MPLFTEIEDIKKYINVSKNLDIRLLLPYEDVATRKITEFIPKEEFETIENNHAEIFDTIKGAIANYMVAFAIPFLKTRFTNTGANNFQDDKVKKSEWWDVRDFGLSAVKIADESLTVAINLLLDTALKNKLTLISSEVSLYKTPNDFSEIYNIGNSWDVLKKLTPIIEHVWRVYMRERLKNCTIEVISENAEVNKLLKSVVAYYTIADAVTEPTLLFTISGVVMQWEELPWQKSLVVSEQKLEKLEKKYFEKANDTFAILLQYLKDNHEGFPCFEYTPSRPIRETIEKKSGLYL
ncbi:DUF6712 family protein [Tenacibaculum maritimum]|uniref:DUF6712 family protein n=1 Tax=Tenacibaculum maritimum TaxID=107401 RepID=UPI003875E901